MTSHVAKSRQKNCSHCVLIKRRCDRRRPVCTRCAETGDICTYVRLPKPRRLHAESNGSLGFPSDQISSIDDADAVLATNTTFPLIPALDAEAHGHFGPTSSCQPSFLMSEDVELMAGPSMNLARFATSEFPNDIEQISPNHDFDRPGSPADDESILAYENMAGICRHVESWDLYDEKAPLHFVVQRLKQFTRSIAEKNAAPFLHRRLYTFYTPPCILTSFAVNLLYINRTKENTPTVMRTIHRSVEELITAETQRISPKPVEKLARTQALFLFQIIRLLDGDIKLRAQGEKDTAILKVWLQELCRVRENLGDLKNQEDATIRSQPPHNWDLWIFAESVRRTIFMSYSFLALYDMMRGLPANDGQNIWYSAHRWTMSRHLWEAGSQAEFSRAWRAKPQFIVTNYSLRRFLEFGTKDDVDDFGEIILSLYMGIDEAKEFLGERP